MVMSSKILGIRDRTKNFDPSDSEIGHIFHLSLSHIRSTSPTNLPPISPQIHTFFTPWGDLHRCRMLSSLSSVSPVALAHCSCMLLLSVTVAHRCRLLLSPVALALLLLPIAVMPNTLARRLAPVSLCNRSNICCTTILGISSTSEGKEHTKP